MVIQKECCASADCASTLFFLSSLSHFMFFPFDKIKIDKSFDKKVRNVTNDCAAIIRTVAKLSKALDARTVAEGVETQTHCDLIKADSYSLG